MILARWRVIALILAVVAGAAALGLAGRPPNALPPRPANERPTLLLLTSLPLVFGEQFSLEGGGTPALKALESRYRIVPISVSDDADLAKGRLLLMAHPQAQPAEDLVALDSWVRRGGRVLLLADPLLDWPSERPLGDRLRPPPMFMDTGLLAHWGLTLDTPERREAAIRKLAGFDITTVSPGSLHGHCDVSRDGLVAHCRIGKGAATVVADADFVDADRLGPAAKHNLDALLAELAAIEAD